MCVAIRATTFCATFCCNCKKTRPSRRHPGTSAFRFATIAVRCLTYLQQTAGDLVEAMNMQATCSPISPRAAMTSSSRPAVAACCAACSAVRGKNAMHVEAREFNRMAEEFYREGLRRQHLRESSAAPARRTADALERSATRRGRGGCLRHGVRVQDLERFLSDIETRVLDDDLSLHEISALLNLLLLLIEQDHRTAQEARMKQRRSSVHRPRHRQRGARAACWQTLSSLRCTRRRWRKRRC